jgi:hypothetical protein
VEPKPQREETAASWPGETQSHDSSFQARVVLRAKNEGIPLESGVKLPVLETEADGLARDVGLLWYADHVEVHKGRRIDSARYADPISFYCLCYDSPNLRFMIS